MQVTRIPFIDAPKGTIGLGAGLRAGGTPYFDIDTVSSMENNNDVDLVPLYLYEGEYLFIHGTEAGLHIVNGDHIKIDALFRYRFDRLESDASDYYQGMEDRDQSLDGGFSFSYKSNWGQLSATWVADMQDNHNGEEVNFTYRYTFETGYWSLSPFISYVYQDSDLTNYYYGVTPEEARLGRPAYSPDIAKFMRAGINTSYYLSPRLLLFANLAFEEVDSTIENSPLVEESTYANLFAGVTYLFGNNLENTYIQKNSYRSTESSWRVNYGYTAEETFHKVHRGNVKRSEDVHTSLAGLTLGKLLSDGHKIDYWGRLSLNRRLENDHQGDFWEYNAYVMAMGTGYSPWNRQEIFRYGFGFGFSYAEKVPIVEQVKQAKRSENTAHFLNYLEAQIDFPMQNLFGKNAPNNCYLGLTLVHRSGIFSNSDILGNVAGGSDVLTSHIECKH